MGILANLTKKYLLEFLGYRLEYPKRRPRISRGSLPLTCPAAGNDGAAGGVQLVREGRALSG